MTPEGLTAHLAEYFEMMVDTLQGERATVDKMVGDAIIAFWGAPLPDAEHAKNAVRGVARCRERLAELNARWREQGKPELPTCFGLDVGPLVVGNVGSPSRLNYTVLGDTVNLASRIEGLNRRYGTEILASESLKDAAGDEWCWRLVDAVAVKGKREAVRIYELLGSRDDTSSERLEFARAYERAFEAYQTRQFDEAGKLLAELAARWPDDRSLESLQALCAQFGSKPPPLDWDGVARLDFK
jgi:adenylate cyclase